MRPLVAALLLMAILGGCLGGGDDALDPNAVEDSTDGPTLPEGLEMEGAEVVEYTRTTVVWAWDGTVSPGTCCLGTPDENAEESRFDAPPGQAVAIQVTLTSPGGYQDLLYLRIDDASGATVCDATTGVTFAQPPISCTGYRTADDEPARWAAQVSSPANVREPIPFTLQMILTVGSTELPTAQATGEPGPTRPGASHVVIGFDDSGINPYHEAFRDDSPEAYRHPATYIDGYPAGAQALALTLDAESYVEALASDVETWAAVEAGQLYWVPGTRIIGATMPDADVIDEDPQWFCQPVLDCYHHGTAVTSRAVTAEVGLCPTCKIVATQGYPNGFEWLVEQPWVDVISISWQEDNEETVGHRSGDNEKIGRKPTFYASGNGAAAQFGLLGTPATMWSHQGAPNAIVVGSHDNGRVTLWTGTVPNLAADVCPDVAFHRQAAGFYPNCGTSFSAPYAAGAGAALILEARALLDDGRVGVHDGILASGDHTDLDVGPLADGKLSIEDLKRLLYTTADPRPAEQEQDGDWCDPSSGNPYCALAPTAPLEWQTIPDGVPQYYFIGYGAVTPDTLEHAKRVLRGEEPMPERPMEDAFFALDQEVRKALMEVEP